MLQFQAKYFFTRALKTLPQLESFAQVESIPPQRLEQNDVGTLINNMKLENWAYLLNNKQESLHYSYKFENFYQAFTFMSQTAQIGQMTEHHPEWFNVYNTVTIDFTTHDCGGISYKDFLLAQILNQLSTEVSENTSEFGFNKELDLPTLLKKWNESNKQY